jgi:hypothetical protein
MTDTTQPGALTVELIGEYIADSHTEAAAAFINEKAQTLYYASYSRGTYGRIIRPLLSRFYPRVNWNGASTAAGLEVVKRLEAKGYAWAFDHSINAMTFRKAAA